MSKPDLQIEGSALVQMRSYCAYAWRRGEEYLYVGCSGLGLSRPLGCHNVIDQCEPVQPHDTLDVWYFNDWQDASAFEQAQIKAHRPLYNSMIGFDRKENLNDTPGVGPPCKTIRCRMCKEPFPQDRWYQVECTRCSKGDLAAKKANRERRLKAERRSGQQESTA